MTTLTTSQIQTLLRFNNLITKDRSNKRDARKPQNEYKLTELGIKYNKSFYDLANSYGMTCLNSIVYIDKKTNKKKHMPFGPFYGDKTDQFGKPDRSPKNLIKYKSKFNRAGNCVQVLTGKLHGGYIGIDIDIKNNTPGATAVFYMTLMERYNFSDTLTGTSPSGGLHFVYKLSKEQQDILGDAKFNSELKLFGCDIDVIYNAARFIMSGVYMDSGYQFLYRIIDNSEPAILPKVIFDEIIKKIKKPTITDYMGEAGDDELTNNGSVINIRTGKNKPTETLADQQYDERTIRKLLDILNVKRVTEYSPWFKVIVILHYCSVTDKNKTINYLSLAHEWSKRCRAKYDKADLDKFWKQLDREGIRENPLTLGTLHHFARTDNPEKYQQFQIEECLHKTNSFPDNQLSINKVIFADDFCVVKLNDEYCPFIEDSHGSQTMYIEASNIGLTMRCTECLANRKTVQVSQNIMKKYFKIKSFKDTNNIDDIDFIDDEPADNIEFVNNDNEDVGDVDFIDDDDEEDAEVEDESDDEVEVKKKEKPVERNKIGLTLKEIFLSNESKYVTEKITENTKYISEDAKNKFKEYGTVIVHSPTGSGKTTTIEELIKSLDPNASILSIISRRTMSSMHKKCFKEMNMTSYLDPQNKRNYKRYIVSLEQLRYVKNNYDFLILDESTSLLLHIYSSTMKRSRLPSFTKLIDVLQHCKKVIVCDANITDMTLDFIASTRSHTELVYYRNKYKNKKGVNLNIYHRTNNKIKKEIEIFCKPIIKLIKKRKSVIVMCDSKSITNNVYSYLLKFVKDKDYFRVYTKDSGILEEIENCNEVWKDKCVLFSPKIVYGIDVLIEYDHVFAIYKGNTMDSFSMLQQISRTRNTKNVDVLFLTKHYKESTNNHITYKMNKFIEEAEFKKFLKYLNDRHEKSTIDKVKEHIFHELQALVTTGKNIDILHEINENSIFGRLHLYASWYKRLFNYNKCQLFVRLCKDQGYTVSTKEFAKDDSECQYEDVKEKMVEEIVKQTDDKHGENDLIDIKHRKEIIGEGLKSRLKILNIDMTELKEDPELQKIVMNEEKFSKCLNSIILYYTRDMINNKELDSYAENFTFIEKDKRLYKVLEIIEWLETLLKVDRFNIIDLKVDNKELGTIKKELKKQLNLLQYLSAQTSEKARIKEVTKRIQSIKSDDRLKKFVMDIVNQFDDFYDYTNKQIREKNKKRRYIYTDFKFDESVMVDHIKFINCKNIDPSKFIDAIKDKVVKRDFADDVEMLDEEDENIEANKDEDNVNIEDIGLGNIECLYSDEEYDNPKPRPKPKKIDPSTLIYSLDSDDDVENSDIIRNMHVQKSRKPANIKTIAKKRASAKANSKTSKKKRVSAKSNSKIVSFSLDVSNDMWLDC